MSHEQLDRSLREDVAWCYDAVADVSRTFALTVSELDEPMARDICVGYLLCRVADTIEDAGHVPPAAKHGLLVTYSRVFDPEDDTTIETFMDEVEPWIPAEPDDDWAVVAEAPRVVGTFRGLEDASRRAIRPPVRELIEGMAMFVDRYADHGGLRLRTVEELEEYCWYAAGTVGNLVTGLLSRNADPSVRETLHNNARSFALLLQLVNVAKDVAVDYEEENNVYLPAGWLAEAETSAEDIGAGRSVDALASVVARLTEHAATYLDGAQAWLEAMPKTRGNTLSAWAVPYLLAVGTIRELESRPADVIEEGGVKIPREEVYAVISRFEDPVDASELGHLRAQIRERPFHEY